MVMKMKVKYYFVKDINTEPNEGAGFLVNVSAVEFEKVCKKINAVPQNSGDEEYEEFV